MFTLRAKANPAPLVVVVLVALVVAVVALVAISRASSAQELVANDGKAATGKKMTAKLNYLPEKEAAIVRAEIRSQGIRVPEPKEGRVYQPYGQAYGGCGTSWIYLSDGGYNRARINFGVDVSAGPYMSTLSWRISLRVSGRDPYYTPGDVVGFNPPRERWTATRYPSATVNAYYIASWTRLTVIRSNGAVCTGPYPSSVAYLT